MFEKDEIEKRRLVIKSFHIDKVEISSKTSIEDGTLTINKILIDEILKSEPLIERIELNIIEPGDHNRWTNSIMDIIPISTKVLGGLGEGITHTITGVYFMLTGVDAEGVQVAEFGSSEGILKDQLFLNRAGTPAETDIIISFGVVLKAGEGHHRPGPTAAHRACDKMVQDIREVLKRLKGNSYTERHEYYDVVRSGKKKVVIIKQVAGQGAMYDTQLFSKEPSGFAGGRSIIDMGNMPVILSPNEYRDGAIRAMH
ncbi:proline reductase cluster protein PrdD [Tissierella praeacuta]|uniref:proline reductase cluster protein PrdD n=1 Tax=Tissierella praeacuta TaxID=43131 RepID=UPI0033422E1E